MGAQAPGQLPSHRRRSSSAVRVGSFSDQVLRVTCCGTGCSHLCVRASRVNAANSRMHLEVRLSCKQLEAEAVAEEEDEDEADKDGEDDDGGEQERSGRGTGSEKCRLLYKAARIFSSLYCRTSYILFSRCNIHLLDLCVCLCVNIGLCY